MGITEEEEIKLREDFELQLESYKIQATKGSLKRIVAVLGNLSTAYPVESKVYQSLVDSKSAAERAQEELDAMDASTDDIKASTDSGEPIESAHLKQYFCEIHDRVYHCEDCFDEILAGTDIVPTSPDVRYLAGEMLLHVLDLRFSREQGSLEDYLRSIEHHPVVEAMRREV